MRWHTSPVISKYYPYWYNKNDFSSHYISLYLLLSFKSMIYSLVQERDHFNHSKRTWFPFILMISDQNKVGLKYEPGCFADFINCWHHNEHPVVRWFHFTFKVRLLFFFNWIFLLWLRTLSRILLTLQYQNEWNLLF